ncbi:MAG: hypothetical protein U1G07_03075 [Verrucomicrobiota bacterium]
MSIFQATHLTLRGRAMLWAAAAFIFVIYSMAVEFRRQTSG